MGAVALAAILFILYWFDPSRCGIFPHCPFRELSGLLCPGCGSQRAVHALLHMDLAAAFRSNALLVLLLPLVALLLVAAAFRRRFNGLYRAANSRPVMLGFAVTAVVWWVVRNVFAW